MKQSNEAESGFEGSKVDDEERDAGSCTNLGICLEEGDEGREFKLYMKGMK